MEEMTVDQARKVVRDFSARYKLPIPKEGGIVPESRIVAVTPEIVKSEKSPERRKFLADLVGRPMEIGGTKLLIVPPDHAAMDALLILWLSSAEIVMLEEYGEGSDSALNDFSKKAAIAGFTVLERKPLESRTFQQLFRQIIANLAGVKPEAIPEVEWGRLERALAVLA